ncbi:transposase [Saccharothrix syringae]|uniref:transposase n=1 Tax=Saccharothrix syringae TaxID=103733 RepID=UPI003D15892B
MDSRSARAAATVGKATRGWDGGKKVAGRKRHIVVDTLGLLVAVLVTPASTQDRVAARSLPRRMRDTAGRRCPTSPCCPADGRWSARWRGSPDTAAASATTNDCLATTRPWSAGP